MEESDWLSATTYYGPHDVDGRSSVLRDDVRTFRDLPRWDADGVTVELLQKPVVVPGKGPRLRLYPEDLAILVELLKPSSGLA